MIPTIHRYVLPAALSLLPSEMDSRAAHVMLLAIAGQESGFRYRRQVGGPARGLWQFERIGVQEVFRHPASARHATTVLSHLLYAPSSNSSVIHQALADNDILACAVARLALWRDPHPLPVVGDEDAAWALYERIWRPGKPHRDRWGGHYARAIALVG